MKQEEIKAIIERVISSEEKRVGHAYDAQGGRGLSMFCKVITEHGTFRTYGNGVVADELSQALRKAVPGFKQLQTCLD